MSYFNTIIVVCTIVTVSAIRPNRKFIRLFRYDDQPVLGGVPTLGHTTDSPNAVGCAMDCAALPACSLFAYNTIAARCVLYPAFIYHNTTFQDSNPKEAGQVYYAYYLDWCPVQKEFLLERETSLCFYVSEIMLTWEKSIEACRSKNARLMIIKNPAKQRALSKMFEQDTVIYNEHVWIGASDLDVGDNVYRFHWIDGTEVVNYFWYSNSQPNGQLYGEYCMGVLKAGMYDRVCATGYRFLCDIPSI